MGHQSQRNSSPYRDLHQNHPISENTARRGYRDNYNANVTNQASGSYRDEDQHYASSSSRPQCPNHNDERQQPVSRSKRILSSLLNGPTKPRQGEGRPYQDTSRFEETGHSSGQRAAPKPLPNPMMRQAAVAHGSSNNYENHQGRNQGRAEVEERDSHPAPDKITEGEGTWNKERAAYHENMQKMQDHIQAVEKANTDLISRIRQTEERLEKAIDARNAHVGTRDSDASIIDRFHHINEQINTWSIPFAHENKIKLDPMPKGMPEQIQRVLSAASIEEIHRMLKDKKRRRLFVRGYVGLEMVGLLGGNKSTGSDIWLPDLVGQSVQVVSNDLERLGITPQERNNWRASTCQLLAKQNESFKEAARIDVEKAADLVMAVVTRFDLLPVAAISESRNQLVNIFFMAADFLATIRCHRAIWTVRFFEPIPTTPMGFLPARFEDDFMDDNNPEDTTIPTNGQMAPRVVRIFITPVLYKRGNTDGDMLDVKTVMKKALVSCR